MENVSGLASSYPHAAATLLIAGYFEASESIEIVIVGDNDDKMHDFNKEMYARFIPNKIVVGNTNGNKSDLLLLQGRQGAKEPTYYFCRNQTCRLPVTNIDELKKELDWVAGNSN